MKWFARIVIDVGQQSVVTIIVSRIQSDGKSYSLVRIQLRALIKQTRETDMGLGTIVGLVVLVLLLFWLL